MRKSVVAFSLLGVLASISATAMAGYTYSVPVHVTPGQVAYGSINAARYAADGNQEIWCSVATSGLIHCSAWDATNSNLFCTTTNSAWAPVVAAINSTSYIYFTVNNGVCASIWVQNDSALLQ
jgi:hypothetical protein